MKLPGVEWRSVSALLFNRSDVVRNQMPFRSLETERLILRRFTNADLPILLAYRNDPEIARFQSWESFSQEEAQAFLQEQQGLEPGMPGKWFQFAIELKSSGLLIGDSALHVDEQGRQGEIGFTLGRQHQGKGFAIEAVSKVFDYAFMQLNLHRIAAITDCRNHSSVALLERLGLRREGHFIQNIFFKGEWGDEYSYAVLKEEWSRR
jgi:RimJ/RimL family protein N-acetyltransferase